MKNPDLIKVVFSQELNESSLLRIGVLNLRTGVLSYKGSYNKTCLKTLDSNSHFWVDRDLFDRVKNFELVTIDDYLDYVRNLPNNKPRIFTLTDVTRSTLRQKKYRTSVIGLEEDDEVETVPVNTLPIKVDKPKKDFVVYKLKQLKR